VVAPLRRAAIVLFASLMWPLLASAQPLAVDAVGDRLRIRAPGFSFLKGDPLDRLKDGRSVRVELVALVLPAPGKTPTTTVRRIFALSYDLWEERFAVTTVDTRPQSVTHLSQAAAESWCVEQLAIPLDAVGRGKSFWIRLEYRLVEAADGSDPEDAGYTLQALIDLLSRRRKTEPAANVIEGGPFTVKPRGTLARR
jgi:hypothetical protein